MELLGPYELLHRRTEAAHAYVPVLKASPHDGRWMPVTPNLASSGLAVFWCFSVQVHRAIPTPLSQAKCANWMKAGAVAPGSCHTGSICRYGSSTHARVLSSGLGAVAFIH